eukprot:TRINITY_DN2876_c0_g1_i2.p1 TRINITY_DN2876_c0_g1~~TRINITY_DN2876_c0_g1_i2.p1  ORF type:complete len:252 (+),score=49.44 TRINITY_DN2876_c0_g1_i2:252-1007(+)
MSLQEIADKRKHLENEILQLEKQIYDLETNYLEETMMTGNIIKGFESYLSNKNAKNQLYNNFKKQKCNPNERIFSLSSVTSPASTNTGDDTERIAPGGLSNPYVTKRTKKKKSYAVYDSSTKTGKHDRREMSPFGKKGEESGMETASDILDLSESQSVKDNVSLTDKAIKKAKKSTKKYKKKYKKATSQTLQPTLTCQLLIFRSVAQEKIYTTCSFTSQYILHIQSLNSNHFEICWWRKKKKKKKKKSNLR